MNDDGLDYAAIRCRILWKLSRNHTWSRYIPVSDLLGIALATEGHDLGRSVIEELKNEPYTAFQQGRGLGLKNDPDSQALVAFELRDIRNYTELQVEATLSRFYQAGGFDEYDQPPES